MKILIVDDNKENLYLLRVMLTGKNYAVVSAENGMEAWEKLNADSFDLIISDILMPVMDGFTLCRKCKEDEKLRNIPFVFYTATYKDERDEELALKMGADKYILKPLEPQAFLKIIQELFADIEKGRIAPKPALEKAEGEEVYKLYSERLVEKLERKMLALESETAQRKQSEAKLRGINRLLRTIRNVNQLIIRGNDRKKILKGICKILLSTGGYSGTWVALFDNSKKLTDVSEGGLGNQFKPLLKELERGRLAYCAQQAMTQSDAVVVTPKTQSDCGGCVLSKGVCTYDTICVRLEYQKKIYGVLSALAPKSIDLLNEEKGLFNELAHDIAFALHKIELAEKHEQAVAALQRSEEKYRSLVDNVRVGIFRSQTGAAGRYLEVNRAMEKITGYSRKELLRMRISDLYVHPEEREAVLKEVVSMRGKTTKELSFRKKDGTEIVVLDTETPVRDSTGEVVHFDGILEDITERRRMQEQLILTDRLASIGEVSSGIAHELNNPLTAVIGFSEMLLDRAVPDDIREDLDTIYSEAKRAANVVRNLLTFARKHPLGKQPVNINGVIQKVLDIREYEQRVNNIQVDTRFSDDLPEITADGFQLQQVFLNMVINAEYFMTEAHRGGTLTITTEKAGDVVRASLADDGPGISKEKLGHIFDPFFTTKEVGKGTGLGLSICHGIITEHGGRIYAKSEAGKGAIFIVELPIADAASSGAIDEQAW
jgi:PAS domain S-box-containing protein